MKSPSTLCCRIPYGNPAKLGNHDKQFTREQISRYSDLPVYHQNKTDYTTLNQVKVTLSVVGIWWEKITFLAYHTI